MAERTGVYFVSDVHLGLKNKDPEERERRFVSFLKSIPAESAASLYLLGDIWDFWYEYRDVIPKEGTRVIAELIRLMDGGVEVYFAEGNHDMWTFSYLENLGVHKISQPYRVNIGGKDFCVGHGDGLGGADFGYRLMSAVFHSKVARTLFSTLHPTLAFRFGNGWSSSNRRKHQPYTFRGEQESLYRFAVEESSQQHTDYFVFGHFHDKADITLPDGARLFLLKDWMDGGEPHLFYDSATGEIRF